MVFVLGLAVEGACIVVGIIVGVGEILEIIVVVRQQRVVVVQGLAIPDMASVVVHGLIIFLLEAHRVIVVDILDFDVACMRRCKSG